MPYYEYKTKNFDMVLKVSHPLDTEIEIWGQLCFIAQIPLGEIPYDEPVKKYLSPVRIIKSQSNLDLKEKGFTKLVKRDTGVYENVTATGEEARYMRSDDVTTIPHFHNKIKD